MTDALRENAMPENGKYKNSDFANKVLCNGRTYRALHSPAGVSFLRYLVGDKTLVEEPCASNGILFVFDEQGCGFQTFCLGEGFVERLEANQEQ